MYVYEIIVHELFKHEAGDTNIMYSTIYVAAIDSSKKGLFLEKGSCCTHAAIYPVKVLACKKISTSESHEWVTNKSRQAAAASI